MSPSSPLRPALACLAGALLLLAGASRSPAAPPPGYSLVWADEFTGTALDATHWYLWPQVPYEGETISNASVAVANGYLTITAYTSGGVQYSGYLGTRFKYQPLYGYMEASIRFHDAPGTWSAFWMFGDNIGKSSHPHTDGTEPDIAEHRAVDQNNADDISNQIDSALHWDGYDPLTERSVTSTPELRGTGLATGFHTYGMAWTPTSQTFYIDGAYAYTITDSPATDPVPPLAPVSQVSEYLLLTTIIKGASWAGNIPTGGYGTLATSTTKMDVDYVRVYQVGPPAPLAPVNVSATATSSGTKVVWNLADNAPYYNVKRSSVAGGPYATIATTGIAAVGANYLDASAITGVRYYYVVSAVNGPKESPDSLEASTSAAGTPATAHGGQWAAQGILSGTATYANLLQTAPAAANATYEAGVWVRGSGRIRLLVYGGTTLLNSTFIDATPAWAYTGIPVGTGANTSLKYKIDDESAIAGAVSIDDLFLGIPGGTNVLANPGFESGSTGWTLSAGTVWTVLLCGPGSGNEHGGFQAARGVLSGTATYDCLLQTADVAPNTTYQLGVWAKGTGRSRLLVYPVTSSPPIASTFINPTSAWTYYSFSFDSGSNTQVRIKIDDESPVPATIYADDFFLGVAGGANLLTNPGFESGTPAWDSDYAGPVWTIGQW